MRYDHYPERKGTYGVEETHNLYVLYYCFCVARSNSLALVRLDQQDDPRLEYLRSSFGVAHMFS